MDEEREAATGAISHLMTDAEVPAWVTHDAASERRQEVSNEPSSMRDSDACSSARAQCAQSDVQTMCL